MSKQLPPSTQLLKFALKWVGLALLAVTLIAVVVLAVGASTLWIPALSFVVAVAVIVGVLRDRKNLYRS